MTDAEVIAALQLEVKEANGMVYRAECAIAMINVKAYDITKIIATYWEERNDASP